MKEKYRLKLKDTWRYKLPHAIKGSATFDRKIVAQERQASKPLRAS